MKKLGGMLLAFAAVALFIPSVFAEEASTPTKADFVLGTVQDITATKGDLIEGGKIDVDVEHSEDRSTYTFTYNEASLKYVPVNASIGRNMEAAWVGIEITPALFNVTTVGGKYSMGNGEASNAAVQSFTVDGATLSASWDGTMWFHVTKEEMEKAVKETNGVVTRTLVITWANVHEGSAASEAIKTKTQTITVNIVAAGVTLQSKDDKPLWNEDTYKEAVAKAEAEKTTTTATTTTAAATTTAQATTTAAKTKNPKTSDNILIYVSLGVLSLATVSYVGYKATKKVSA